MTTPNKTVAVATGAEAFLALARRTAGELARRSRDRSGAFPKIIVEDT